jgi:glycerophosphoryl diester phosphodiesterase
MTFRIVAHRGVTDAAPGNTMAAFRAAQELGVDAVELDIRLSRDGAPVVHHNYYLDLEERRPIFAATLQDLRAETVADPRPALAGRHSVPQLSEVLEAFAGGLGLELELKGPEPEAAMIVADLLENHRDHFDRIEVTSWSPQLLISLGDRLPGLSTALLFPASEPWMHEDVLAYAALHQARSAHASAVHLHANQLSEQVVAAIRAGGVEVHAHSVNDNASLQLAWALTLPWICTDQPGLALTFRTTRHG